MKKTKILAGLLAAAALLTFTACGNTANEKQGASSSQSGSAAASSQSSSGTSSAEVGMMTQVFGKIKMVAGNEITLSMAEPPQTEQEQEGSAPTEEGGGATITTEAVPATAITPAEGGGDAVKLPKIELTYTGEEKDFQIPAGASVLGTDGSEAGVDSLKKGNVIMMNIDENGKVLLLSVWE